MRRAHTLDEIWFIATKTARSTRRDEWRAWLRDLVGDHDGALWRLADPGPAGRPGLGHSHVLSLGSGPSGFDAAIRAARDNADHDNAAHDNMAHGHAEIRRDRWRRHGTSIVADARAEAESLIVAEVLCTDPRREAEWDLWYDEEHLPDMMACGAFSSGTRWTRADLRPGGANHVTVYEIGDHDVETAIERSAAIMPDLVAAGRKHECHTGGLTWALVRD